jgi:dUTPase
MNIGFHNKREVPANIENNVLIFSCAKPIIIQPSEIRKVQTDITLRVEPGFVLNIISDPNIYSRDAEVFPGTFVLDSSAPEGLLEIPIRNHGKTPLNLMDGALVARGYLSRIVEISIEEITPIGPEKRRRGRIRPAQNTTNVKFEVR